jgi:hypothetical protein
VYISAKVDYAVRALCTLADAEGRPVTAETLASAQGLPAKFLESILNDMRRAGLLLRSGACGRRRPTTRDQPSTCRRYGSRCGPACARSSSRSPSPTSSPASSRGRCASSLPTRTPGSHTDLLTAVGILAGCRHNPAFIGTTTSDARRVGIGPPDRCGLRCPRAPTPLSRYPVHRTGSGHRDTPTRRPVVGRRRR